MAQYINPLLDTGFKIIFGKENQSNEFLRSFLNDLFQDDPQLGNIEKITFLNSENSRETEIGKTIRYDIYCETNNKFRYIVEMQKEPQAYFMERAVYYVSRAFADQGRHRDDDSGEPWEYKLLPVVGVFLCNFFVPGIEKKTVCKARLADVTTAKPLTDLMCYAFIQLPAFKKSVEQCETPLEEWIYILKNMKDMQTIPFTSHRDIFDRLAKVSNVAALSENDRLQYEYDLKKARDYNAEINTAKRMAAAEGRAEGLAEGRAEGLAEGLAEGRAEGLAEGQAQGRIDEKKIIARKMIAMGMSLSDISMATGLSEEDMDSL